jgi:serine/threonine protein kinase
MTVMAHPPFDPFGPIFSDPDDDVVDDPSRSAALADTFAEAAELIGRAQSAVDLFGPWPDDGNLAAATSAYRHLVGLVRPTLSSKDDGPAAEQAFARLAELYAAFGHAKAELAGTPPAKLSSGRMVYTLGAKLAGADLADFYRVAYGTNGTKEGLLELGHTPTANKLLAHEAEVLVRIGRKGEARHKAYVPTLLESFTHKGLATGAEQVANVFEPSEGFVSLAEVKSAYPAGLDVRDAAWMWRRLLVAIGYAHGAGVVHAAITPERILISPKLHGLTLTDWRFSSVAPHGKQAAISKSAAPFAPPELRVGAQVSTATDVFMATRVIETLLDDATPGPIRSFIAGCTLERPEARPQDAWELLSEFDELLERLYGPRQFRPFVMPVISGAPAAQVEA